MITRSLQDKLKKSLSNTPAVVLSGPRQSGKTTLAKMLVSESGLESIYLDLEDSQDAEKLSDPKLFLTCHANKLVIIDEAQVMPGLFPQIRSLIDADRRPGRFLLLGSASPALERQANESLAGRVSYYNLSPLMLSEIPGGEVETLWLRGGFPLSYLSADEDFSVEWRKNFIRSYLGYDLRAMGYDIRLEPVTLSMIMELLAHYQGQQLNINSIATTAQISRQAIARLIDILQETFMVRLLRPYSTNLKSQIVKTPKFYFRDTGILHSILKIHDINSLKSTKSLGASWESFCIEQIIAQTQDRYSVSYLRTADRHEVDLILKESLMSPPILVEFKYSTTPKPEKGFYAIKEKLKPARCYIVHSGQDSYPLADDIMVLSINELSRIWS